MRPDDKKRALFRRWASPAMLGCALLCGLFFMALALLENPTLSRLLFSGLLIAGAILAFSYTEPRAMRSSTLPLMVEVLRFKFGLWLLFGIVWIVRIFGSDPPPRSEWAVLTISFLVGAIAGGVFGLGLLLFLGRNSDVATWEVVRFPVWTVRMSERVKKRTGRGQ